MHITVMVELNSIFNDKPLCMNNDNKNYNYVSEHRLTVLVFKTFNN